MQPNFFTINEIRSDVETIQRILASGIFNPENDGHPLFSAAFKELILCLRDLTYKTEHLSSRINFADDIVISENVSDVTDAIRVVRDAICHANSGNSFVQSTKVRFSLCVSYGKGSVLILPKDTLTSDYDDDVAFFYGHNRLYLFRHIIRAFNEAKQRLLPLTV